MSWVLARGNTKGPGATPQAKAQLHLRPVVRLSTTLPKILHTHGTDLHLNLAGAGGVRAAPGPAPGSPLQDPGSSLQEAGSRACADPAS